MTFTPEQLDELKAPLQRKYVAERQQAGRKLSYIEGWHAIAEANRIFGFDAWTRETVEVKCVMERERKIGREPNTRDGWGVSYTARVRVTVLGVIREGVGTGHGIDVDLGLAHESAIKEAETDAMKRALMTFGNPFGLALYDKDQANVADTPPANDKGGNGQKFGGPLTVTELKKQMRAFAGDLARCDDLDSLIALETSHRPLLDQCMRDLPAWWYGEGDAKGAMQSIEERRTELTAKEADKIGARI